MFTEEAVIAEGITLLYHKNSQKFPVCNSLLVRDEQTVLFDPGFGHSDYFKSIRNDVDLILLSHFHADHHCNANIFNCPVMVHENDRPSLDNFNSYLNHDLPESSEKIRSSWEAYLSSFANLVLPEIKNTFSDNTLFNTGRRKIRIIHAPGHSPGHCTFLIEPDNILFGGDIDPTFYPGLPGTLGNIFSSYEKLSELHINIFLTAHSRIPRKGNKVLRLYRKAIDHRTEYIMKLQNSGISKEEMLKKGRDLIFNGYRPEPYDVWKFFGNRMVNAHLDWIRNNC